WRREEPQSSMGSAWDYDDSYSYGRSYDSSWSGWGRSSRSAATSPSQRTRSSKASESSMSKNKNLDLVVGDRVNHAKYGLGTVVAADGSGLRSTVIIDCGSAGKVRRMLVGGLPMGKLQETRSRFRYLQTRASGRWRSRRPAKSRSVGAVQ